MELRSHMMEGQLPFGSTARTDRLYGARRRRRTCSVDDVGPALPSRLGLRGRLHESELGKHLQLVVVEVVLDDLPVADDGYVDRAHPYLLSRRLDAASVREPQRSRVSSYDVPLVDRAVPRLVCRGELVAHVGE